MSRKLEGMLPAAALGLLWMALPASAGEGSATGRNHLAGEKSPYLREHAGNPVWWWTWTPEALAQARKEDKPIFLSIGYSTCHWCHVMERESFSKDDVAAALNASFIAIKVDREERPDLDAVYLQAVEALSGGGGWPMTVLLTPDGKPFFGGTYLPHDKLLQLLARAAALWKSDRKKLEATGAEVSQALARQVQRESAGSLDPGLLLRFEKAQERSFDSKYGGFDGAPKFPPSYAIRLLLRIHRRSGNPRALDMATRTLDAMARGGIRDHLGGGFHRYATDERWRIPHFEKTLYDQAALAQAYVEGFQATGNADYARVAREILDYVLRDLTGPDGGFFSAEDADSEGEEGKFYVWREADLRVLLGPAELAAVKQAYGITAAGDLPGGGNVLHLVSGDTTSSDGVLARAVEKMKDARRRRVRPSRDEKVLTDWNGLMIAALAQAGRVLDEPRYVDAAARAAEYIRNRLAQPGGSLYHRDSLGEARYAGNLDDYVFLADGLIELFESTFDPHWLGDAAALYKTVEAGFLAPQGNFYFTDGSDASLLFREVRTADNVVPAGNSVAALDLLRLADLRLDPAAAERARAILAATPKDVAASPEAYPMLLMALDYASDSSKEVAIVGDPASAATQALLSAVRAGFTPNMVVALGPPGDHVRGPPRRKADARRQTHGLRVREPGLPGSDHGSQGRGRAGPHFPPAREVETSPGSGAFQDGGGGATPRAVWSGPGRLRSKASTRSSPVGPRSRAARPRERPVSRQDRWTPSRRASGVPSMGVAAIPSRSVSIAPPTTTSRRRALSSSTQGRSSVFRGALESHEASLRRVPTRESQSPAGSASIGLEAATDGARPATLPSMAPASNGSALT